MTVRGLLRTSRKLARLNPRRRRLLLEAAALTETAHLLLMVFRFKKAKAILNSIAKLVFRGKAAVEKADLLWALSTLSRRLGCTCLPRAIGAQTLLRRYGYPAVLRIGATEMHRNFGAHAWVELEGEIVTGGPAEMVKQYVPFPAARLSVL